MWWPIPVCTWAGRSTQPPQGRRILAQLCEGHRMPPVMLCTHQDSWSTGVGDRSDGAPFSSMFVAGARLTVPFGMIIRCAPGLRPAMAAALSHAPEFTIAWLTGANRSDGPRRSGAARFPQRTRVRRSGQSRTRCSRIWWRWRTERGKALYAATTTRSTTSSILRIAGSIRLLARTGQITRRRSEATSWGLPATSDAAPVATSSRTVVIPGTGRRGTRRPDDRSVSAVHLFDRAVRRVEGVQVEHSRDGSTFRLRRADRTARCRPSSNTAHPAATTCANRSL